MKVNGMRDWFRDYVLFLLPFSLIWRVDLVRILSSALEERPETFGIMIPIQTFDSCDIIRYPRESCLTESPLASFLIEGSLKASYRYLHIDAAHRYFEFG